MRCSICDKPADTFIFRHWHCGACIVAIQDAIGNQDEDDFVLLGADEDTPTVFVEEGPLIESD